MDVNIKDNYIYALIKDNSNEGGNSIIQLNKDLSITEAVGALFGNTNSEDFFFGPKRFLGILNKRFYLIDEYYMSSGEYDMDRIVSFDDIAGNGWSTYGSTGTEEGQFYFYENYYNNP